MCRQILGIGQTTSEFRAATTALINTLQAADPPAELGIYHAELTRLDISTAKHAALPPPGDVLGFDKFAVPLFWDGLELEANER